MCDMKDECNYEGESEHQTSNEIQKELSDLLKFREDISKKAKITTFKSAVPLHPYVIEGELARKITDLIMEYEGRISIVSACGILDVVKDSLLKEVIN